MLTKYDTGWCRACGEAFGAALPRVAADRFALAAAERDRQAATSGSIRPIEIFEGRNERSRTC